jgi:glutathione peroxidase
MDKVDVNGDNEDPVYTYLKSQKKSLMMSRIKWNFEKFLIAKDGSVAERYASITTPDTIGKDVEKLLAA